MFKRVSGFGVSVNMFIAFVFGDTPFRGVLFGVFVVWAFRHFGSVPLVLPVFLFGAFLFAVGVFVWGGGGG